MGGSGTSFLQDFLKCQAPSNSPWGSVRWYIASFWFIRPGWPALTLGLEATSAPCYVPLPPGRTTAFFQQLLLQRPPAPPGVTVTQAEGPAGVIKVTVS